MLFSTFKGKNIANTPEIGSQVNARDCTFRKVKSKVCRDWPRHRACTTVLLTDEAPTDLISSAHTA
jgi:hypothetical protein